MLRALLCALAIAASVVPALAQNEGLIAQGWSVGTVETIARARPSRWALISERHALRSNVTGIVCPQALSEASFTAAKDSDFVAECWYATGEREGVWISSLDSVELARATLANNYSSLSTDSDIELAPTETSSVGACTLEVRRMRNVHGFWVTLRDLYAPNAFHQVRTITFEDSRRSEMETLAQELTDLSIASQCAGTS